MDEEFKPRKTDSGESEIKSPLHTHTLAPSENKDSTIISPIKNTTSNTNSSIVKGTLTIEKNDEEHSVHPTEETKAGKKVKTLKTVSSKTSSHTIKSDTSKHSKTGTRLKKKTAEQQKEGITEESASAAGSEVRIRTPSPSIHNETTLKTNSNIQTHQSIKTDMAKVERQAKLLEENEEDLNEEQHIDQEEEEEEEEESENVVDFVEERLQELREEMQKEMK